MNTAERSGSTALPVAAPPESRRKRSRLRTFAYGVLVLAVLSGALAAYYGLSGFFNANGTWYGTMYIQSGGKTPAIETYMDVSTSLTGSLSGTGSFCIPLPFENTSTVTYSLSGMRAFPLPGNDHPNQAHPLILTAQYTVPLFLGFTLPLSPSLTLGGDATANGLHLTGGDDRAATSLNMTRGTEAAFLAACKTLSPLG